jgi:hypothetical protein
MFDELNSLFRTEFQLLHYILPIKKKGKHHWSRNVSFSRMDKNVVPNSTKYPTVGDKGSTQNRTGYDRWNEN